MIEADAFSSREQSQKELYKKHHDTADGRIRVWLGLRQIMNATDRLLIETRDLAKEFKTGIHMVHTQVSRIFICIVSWFLGSGCCIFAFWLLHN